VEGIDEFLSSREASGLRRHLRQVTSRNNGKITVGGREYWDFSSNDYLGLSHHPALIEAGKAAIEKYGTGSCASRLLGGSIDIHHQLESEIATLKGKEAALIFNSGYQANLAIISALCDEKDLIICDKLAHASILDGVALSGAKLLRFKHNDLEHLAGLLKKERANYKNCLVITESVFSMDGDIAPLRELVDIKIKYDCDLMVDEAHATGVFGKNGAGLVSELGLSDQVDLIMGTFGKALASSGAYLAASKNIIEYLINCSRGFIFSTAPAPVTSAVSLAAIKSLRDEPWRREKLLENSAYFRAKLMEKNFTVYGATQIVPVILGDNFKALATAEELQAKGYLVMAVRPPAVPANTARLRFSLSAVHEKETINAIVETMVV
jgi:8-amino-7-oxononanoate synthase